MSVFDLVQAPIRQAATLDETAHRPWSLPERPWVMGQTWDDLLFIHYPLAASRLRGLVPRRARDRGALRKRRARCYAVCGDGLRGRGIPALRLVSSFLELNVRTYVARDGRPGIWFFSLDATSQLAVAAARRLYRLPYFRAQMSLRRLERQIAYSCRRDDEHSFPATYGQQDNIFHAEPESLEHFLTERYCLYSADATSTYRAEIHHRRGRCKPPSRRSS